MNVVERGEHQLKEVAYSRFEPLGGENGGRTMKFHGEVESGRSLNWRLRDLRFPARWWSELEFEGPWRGLGRWRIPGCGGFGNHGVELVDSDRWRLCFSVRLELEVEDETEQEKKRNMTAQK